MTSEPNWRHKRRPVNLNLLAFRFPVTAIVSILHRLSGVLLFVFVPFLVWMFSLTLASPQDFTQVQIWLSSPLSRAITWFFLLGLAYHLFAGVRHLIMDLGFGESLIVARITAYLIIALTAVTAVLAGVWLW